MTDLHSHVLPGLDDGAPDLAASLQMCRIAVGDGTRTLVATPHLFNAKRGLSPSDIATAGQSLAAALAGQDIALDLRWAAEVPFVEDLPARIRSGEVPTLDRTGRYILLEPPMAGDCSDYLSDVVFRLRLMDITAVIAHPERVEAFYLSRDLPRKLTDQGAVLQLNADGVVGGLGGSRRQSLVWNLLRNGLAGVVASDAHDAEHRSPRMSPAREACARALGPEAARLLFTDNPAAIARGDPVQPLPVTQAKDPPASHRVRRQAAIPFLAAWRRLLGRSKV
jgi:protein-tyrosine phosphatase